MKEDHNKPWEELYITGDNTIRRFTTPSPHPAKKAKMSLLLLCVNARVIPSQMD
jgi:hypothetical protein